MFKRLTSAMLVLLFLPLYAQRPAVSVYDIGILPDSLGGTSGLVYDQGTLLTVNDHSALKLYVLDTADGDVLDHVCVSDQVPKDMEEIQLDSDFFYLGDIGNNCGCRKDLHILRVDRRSVSSDNPIIDTIAFFYPEQMLFSSDYFSTDFDCEAFVVDGDSVFLFTKQWSALGTSCYAIPNKPGVHVAELRYSLPVRGVITGAALSDLNGALFLVGYSNRMRPFLLRLVDWRKSGKKRFDKWFLSVWMAQVEAVAEGSNGVLYITNEAFSLPGLMEIPPRLRGVSINE